MRISDEFVEQLLKKMDIKKDQLDDLHQRVKEEKRPLQDVVLSSNLISEKKLTEAYAKEIDVPFVEVDAKNLNKEVLGLVPERTARQYAAVVTGVADDGTKEVAMADPDDVQAINFLQKLLGSELKITVATRTNILNALDQYRGNIGSEISKVASESDDEEDEDENISEEDVAEDSPIAQTVNLIIEYAIKSNASDIHIEPRDGNVQIRYRIDGVLREANKLPKKTLAALVSRIKILSNLKIDERRAPQDGRFKITMNGRIFAFRVSTLPVQDGEKVVMRVLDESSEPLSLEQLGFWGLALENIQKAIKEPHGMILVTGPTGSGKSTTLHSVLNILNKPDVNISTVEDPVEYRLEGVNQTQVNVKAGMTFVNGLRALLRQDPNIIMVGEIRDGETAGLGVQAALTGHLVFSTLHTNNAATCLPRLLDMNIEPFLISSVVRVVVGQRLVRRIVPEECEEYEPDAKEKEEIERTFGIKNDDNWKKIMATIDDARKAFDKPKSSKLTFWKPKDDLKDSHTGYRGRMGIYEVLDVSSEVEKLIVANGTSDQIQEQAIKDGMVTMHVDGLVKAAIGMTSIEEILRVTRE
ncbi:MAG: ATPase, T2SS/T4P/T4SS family [Candidatus Saccharibacteria bacterium]|nr:ATPase, T2SS/T4P/T4SS family [Candidatus Saccharibacteria bacterium]